MKIQVRRNGELVADTSDYQWLSEIPAIRFMDDFVCPAAKEGVTVNFDLLKDGALKVGFGGADQLVESAKKEYFAVGSDIIYPENALRGYVHLLPDETILRDEWTEIGRHSFPLGDPQFEVEYEHTSATNFSDRPQQLRLSAFICRSAEEALSAFPPFEKEYAGQIKIRNGRVRDLWSGASAYCANIDFVDSNGEEVRFAVNNIVWHLNESPYAVDFAKRIAEKLEAEQDLAQ